MEISRFLVQSAEPALILAALLLVSDGFFLWRGTARNVRAYRVMVLAVILAWGLIILSYAVLTLAFVTDAFWVGEVFSYSSSGMALFYKLGDPWIGSNGSLLFITVLLSFLYGAYRLQGSAAPRSSRVTAYLILDITSAFLISVTLMQSPFAILDASPAEGMGLNPLLQTPWVLLHPPIIFLGYVVVFFAFALMLAGVVTGTSVLKTRQSLNLPLYASWLLLTAGIALGAIWSYRVLGWGGYWAWDPVETASLLPWLALTIYFHLPFADSDDNRGREFMLMITFVMVLFATALTRGGFSQSLHAFGESPAGYLFLGFAAVSFIVFLFCTRRMPKTRDFFSPGTGSAASIPRSAGVCSLAALLVICFAGTAAPMALGGISGRPVSVGPDFFILLCYPFTLAFVAAVIGCNTRMSKKTFGIVLATVLAIGAGMAFLRFPTPVPLADLGLPLLITAGAILAYRWFSLACTGRFSPLAWGRMAIHFSVIIILLGVFISAAAQTESRPLLAAPGTPVQAPGTGVEITIRDFSLSPATGTVWFSNHGMVAPEYSGLAADVTIREGNSVRNGSLWMYDYLNYGIVSEPLVLSGPGGDRYISMHQTDSSAAALLGALRGEEMPPADVTIVVKYVPFIWLVWLGISLMVAGTCLLFAGELLRKGTGS